MPPRNGKVSGSRSLVGGWRERERGREHRGGGKGRGSKGEMPRHAMLRYATHLHFLHNIRLTLYGLDAVALCT